MNKFAIVVKVTTYIRLRHHAIYLLKSLPIIVIVISHRDAGDMLNKCLTWLQHQTEATPCNTSVLLSLKDIAAKKRYSSMKQKTITSFLNEPN